MRSFVAVAAMAASLVAPSTMLAQKSESAGFFIGVGAEGNAIRQNESQSVTESGGGGSLTLGYGFSKHWSFYGDVSGASINADGGGTYSLGHADLGARLHFRAGPNIVVPFLQAGFAGRGISEEYQGSKITGSGVGFSFGGGFNAHFTPKVALTAAATWTAGTFNHFTSDGQSFDNPSFDATSARVQLGLMWFLRG